MIKGKLLPKKMLPSRRGVYVCVCVPYSCQCYWNLLIFRPFLSFIIILSGQLNTKSVMLCVVWTKRSRLLIFSILYSFLFPILIDLSPPEGEKEVFEEFTFRTLKKEEQ